MQIFGVILAGGTARRMAGADKALMTLAGLTLLERVIARFSPQVDALALSANAAPERYAGFGLPVLGDDSLVGSRGPLSGILAGMRWAENLGASHVASAAVDTPFLPCDLVPRLCLAAEIHPGGLAIAQSAGRDHPTFGLWPIALRHDLERYLRDSASARVLGFVDLHNAARAEFADQGMFTNLNSPADLARAEAGLATP
jgi:molybdenum cofactor guanylyltransferase